MVPRKMVPREKWFPEKWSPEKWSPEKWSPEKYPSKTVLRQNNARKLEQLFHFYQLIPLHTHKDVWRLHHYPTYAPNCRTLKESRKICCRVLGFHRLITSEHSTHTHTHHNARRSPHDFLFPCFGFVVEFEDSIDWSHPNIPHTLFSFLSFPGTNFSFLSFAGTIFPGTILLRDHFCRGPFSRDSVKSGGLCSAEIWGCKRWEELERT